MVIVTVNKLLKRVCASDYQVPSCYLVVARVGKSVFNCIYLNAYCKQLRTRARPPALLQQNKSHPMHQQAISMCLHVFMQAGGDSVLPRIRLLTLLLLRLWLRLRLLSRLRLRLLCGCGCSCGCRAVAAATAATAAAALVVVLDVQPWPLRRLLRPRCRHRRRCRRCRWGCCALRACAFVHCALAHISIEMSPMRTRAHPSRRANRASERRSRTRAGCAGSARCGSRMLAAARVWAGGDGAPLPSLR